MKPFVVKKTLEKQLSHQGALNTGTLISNTVCPWTSVAQETQHRQEASADHLLLLRSQLPLILQALNRIPDYRNPRKIKHKLSVLMLYGLLMFVFQFSSRRQVNKEMTRPQFIENLKAFFLNWIHYLMQIPCTGY